MKEQSLKNLKPWKPGQSGNLAGRPRGSKNRRTIYEMAGQEIAKALDLGKNPDRVWIELFKKGVKKGFEGDFQFYKDTLDRVFGQPKQPVKDDFSIDIIIKEMEPEQERKIREKRQKLPFSSPSEPQN